MYALQTQPRSGDIHKQAHPALIGDLSPYLKDFVDTAAVIEQLDLIITVDTSIAHLAGALGKPVWVLIPHAPDWRWLLKRIDTPWYPTMRLFRQTQPNRWDDVAHELVETLGAVAASRSPHGEDGSFLLDSVFVGETGTPRYRMPIPRGYLSDPGIRYLVDRERYGIGYEYATRSFLDTHLRPGDLFIDIGAHWGIMTLHAATRWPGRVAVLSCEPTPRNLPHLREWVETNDLSDVVEIIPHAIADGDGRGAMLPQSTMGHSLAKTPNGDIVITSVDDILAARPDLAARRIIVKIDVEGGEADVIAGMSATLARGQVDAVIWERGRSHSATSVQSIRARLDRLGFSPWRFETEDEAGPLVPFFDDGRIDNIFELSATFKRALSYGETRIKPAHFPDPLLEDEDEARTLFQMGIHAQSSGQLQKALSAYAESATLDRRNPDLYNNLGVAMQQLQRWTAAEAAYRQCLALNQGAPDTLSNLGSVLREQGKFEESITAFTQALTLSPASVHTLANFAHTLRDLNRPRDAILLLDRALRIKPGATDIIRDRADAFLQQEDYDRGLALRFSDRIDAPTPAMPAVWDGAPLQGKHLQVTVDTEIEDTFRFATLFTSLPDAGAGKTVVACHPGLHRLFSSIPGIDRVIGVDELDGDVDCHIPLSQLAVRLAGGTRMIRAPVRSPPRFKPTFPLPSDGRPKVGLVWKGDGGRSGVALDLGQLLPLLDDPTLALYSLQQGIASDELRNFGADILVQDLSARLTDYFEAAAILSELDLLITVDAPIAYLAGWIGVKTVVLLPFAAHWRWPGAGSTVTWFPSLHLLRQDAPGSWKSSLNEIAAALRRVHLKHTILTPD